MADTLNRVEENMSDKEKLSFIKTWADFHIKDAEMDDDTETTSYGDGYNQAAKFVMHILTA